MDVHVPTPGRDLTRPRTLRRVTGLLSPLSVPLRPLLLVSVSLRISYDLSLRPPQTSSVFPCLLRLPRSIAPYPGGPDLLNQDAMGAHDSIRRLEPHLRRVVTPSGSVHRFSPPRSHGRAQETTKIHVASEVLGDRESRPARSGRTQTDLSSINSY